MGTELALLSLDGQPRNAEEVVSGLERVGGNLKRFVALYPHKEGGDELIVSAVERWLKNLDDKTFYKRWEAAIKTNMVVRLRLLQNAAIDRLEALAQTTGENPALPWLLMSKEAAAHKMILGDLFAAQTYAAKQKPIVAEETGDASDDAELAEVMAGG